jgi:hypothetical protein
VARPALALAATLLLAAGCGSSGGAATSALTTTASNSLLQGKTGPKLVVQRIGSLPQSVSKAAAVALPGGRLMVLGGYTGASSVDTILGGPPSRLRAVGRLPQPTHDAAAAALGGSVYLFGGGESVSVPNVVRVTPSAGTATAAPARVGGSTGTQFASAVLRYLPHGGTATVARLPRGTRYAGVTALGQTIYVAGGLTTAGPSRTVYALTPGGKPHRIATLPAPEDHAALAALNGRLYLVGGRRVLAIDPASGKVVVAARLPVSLSDPTATTVGRQVVVTGGGTNGVWALAPRR